MSESEELQMEEVLREAFASLLEMAVANNKNYEVRESILFELMATAKNLGYAVGIRIDPVEPKWPVLYIELPTGQVSWHIQPHAQVWDGHTTEEKFERIRRFVAGS